MNKNIIIGILILIIIFLSYKNINIAKNIKIDGVNEGYKGQIILNINGKLYEYFYKINDSEYKGRF